MHESGDEMKRKKRGGQRNNNQNKRWTNKLVYVTGGGSGIGFETAKQLLEQGARVCIFDLSLSAPKEAQLRQVAKQEEDLKFYLLDVTYQNTVENRFSVAAKAMGVPDLIFNSAGIVSAVEMMNLGYDEWDRVISINLYGSRNVAHAAGSLLKPGGRLALISSLSGVVGSYGYAAYAASKFGVVGLAQVLRMEWKPRGIGVSVICPPEIETPLVVNERKFRPKPTSALKSFAGHLTVEDAVDQILRSLRKQKFMIIPGIRAKLTWFLLRFAPMRLNHAVSDGIVAKALQENPQ